MAHGGSGGCFFEIVPTHKLLVEAFVAANWASDEFLVQIDDFGGVGLFVGVGMVGRMLMLLIIFLLRTDNVIVGGLAVDGYAMISFKLFFGGMPVDGVPFEFVPLLMQIDIFGRMMHLQFGLVEDPTVRCLQLLTIFKLCFGHQHFLIAHNMNLIYLYAF